MKLLSVTPSEQSIFISALNTEEARVKRAMKNPMFAMVAPELNKQLVEITSLRQQIINSKQEV